MYIKLLLKHVEKYVLVYFYIPVHLRIGSQVFFEVPTVIFLRGY